MCEPHVEYNQYSLARDKARAEGQKATLCLNCPLCVEDTIPYHDGSVRVGFCLDMREFMTLEDMEERTMFDCFEGE